MQELIESPKFEIKIQIKRLKIQTPMIVVLMAQSSYFKKFMKLILALIPKNHFIFMTCSIMRM
jgi:hypothetical protein